MYAASFKVELTLTPTEAALLLAALRSAAWRVCDPLAPRDVPSDFSRLNVLASDVYTSLYDQLLPEGFEAMPVERRKEAGLRAYRLLDKWGDTDRIDAAGEVLNV